MDNPIDINEAMAAFLRENGYSVVKGEGEAEAATEVAAPPDPEPDPVPVPAQPQVVEHRFVLGTPQQANTAALTENDIMVMTSDDLQKNMSQVRDFIIENGGF